MTRCCFGSDSGNPTGRRYGTWADCPHGWRGRLDEINEQALRLRAKLTEGTLGGIYLQRALEFRQRIEQAIEGHIEDRVAAVVAFDQYASIEAIVGLLQLTAPSGSAVHVHNLNDQSRPLGAK